MKRVLLITADQLRADCLGCMGNGVVKTPHMDALAADGVLFRRHYTTAVPCGPSRASLLTGLYPSNHRMITNGTPLDSSYTTLALEMRAGGYDPTLFGYTDIAPDPRGLAPGDPRLTTFEGVLPGFTVGQLLPEHSKDWLADLKRKGYPVKGPGYGIYAPPQPDEGEGLSAQPSIFRAEDSETAWLMDKVINHLDMCGEDPFFVHASFLRPHPPFIAPEPYNNMYRDADIPKAVRAADNEAERAQHPAIGYFQDKAILGHFLRDAGDRPVHDLTDEEVRHIRATYFGLISEVDDHLGRLVAFLKEKGIYDETVIILTSDHGEQLGDHGIFGKACHFEKSYHIPLMIKGVDGQHKGEAVDHFTESVDIMPTLLAACGLPVPPQCDGHSLLPLLKGEVPGNWRDHVCGLYDFRDVVGKAAERRFGLASNQCAALWLRDDRYKYVHFSGLPAIFYDLTQDPGESRNLAGDPAYAQIMLDYAQKLLTWRMGREYGALDRLAVSPNGIVTDPDLP